MCDACEQLIVPMINERGCMGSSVWCDPVEMISRTKGLHVFPCYDYQHIDLCVSIQLR